jgi:hypothetical protein
MCNAVRPALFISLLPVALVTMVDCGGSIFVPAASRSPAVDPPTGTPGPAASAGPSSPPGGGTIVIVVPTPAPVLCVPAAVTIAVGQDAIVACTAQGYVGKFTSTVANPAVASAAVAAGTTTLFYVTGLAAGTTTLSLIYAPPQGAGTLAITVFP